MRRTIISIDDKDKAWLDRESERQGVSMAEIVRRAIALLRRTEHVTSPPLDDLLDRTRGIWKEGDGLEYQRRIRRDWQGRSS